MIFYGKAQERVAVADVLDEVAGWIAEALAAGASPRPVERHAAWVAALVAAGGLAQGLADAGHDDTSPGEEAAMALATALARVMGRSWDSAFADLPAAMPAPVAAALARLRASSLPGEVEVRRTEGFAHYALYPEAHWAAASALAAPRPTRVLGLRSIGTVLAAAAAAALEASVPATVRPTGHPFARHVAAVPPTGPGDVWAVADEGPGLSGSSLGAAADALARAGVPAERIVLMPGHAGPPGPMASDAHRRLWSRARIAVTSFDALLLGPDAASRGLAAWVADLTGPLLAPPEDVAGGAWRRRHYAAEAEWPAVDRQNERRKFLLHGERGRFLLRFAGLGSFGRAKLARARALAEAGLGVAPLGWRHGFLVEPWRADLHPLGRDLDREAHLHRLAVYLAFRARAFPAAAGHGAPLAALLAMARANVAEAFGEGAAARLDGFAAALPGLARASRPIAVDGRLARHEWLGGGGGPPLKADALDHCCGHDLVGCQDVAWDVAGAATEYALSDAEAEALRAAVALASGWPCDAGLVAFFRIAYPAFTLGALTLARDREAGAEAERLAAALAAPRAALRAALG